MLIARDQICFLARARARSTDALQPMSAPLTAARASERLESSLLYANIAPIARSVSLLSRCVVAMRR